MSRHHGPFWTVIGGALMLLSSAPGGAAAQDPLENAPVASGPATRAGAGDKATPDSKTKPDAKEKEKEKPKPEFIAKTPAEWRKILTRMQYAVTREKATEPAFTGKYASGHYRGTFICVCCDAAHVTSELFSTRAKFESGTGWPSFYQVFNNRSVQTAWDYSEVEPRIEVMCRRCGAHLGHVFDDGPPPTGLRFCINSASIKLAAPEADATLKSGTSKASSARPKSKVKARTNARLASKRSRSSDATDAANSASATAADKAEGGNGP